eukprot:CAMPEP_0203961070 /NCGR_PEP_ID=MMETSP0359-20131031/91606_1 /ASSEMBLY_ACC=CAM_ASM_000338 /TAXON_ID=268821 /ORGANISM="Scrippsiella Hangoei, Strain SHTV-5" /LENGTH=49 /DNA_ID= /DNA_START= /DNA_END= /DNA_ORIENTATION=
MTRVDRPMGIARCLTISKIERFSACEKQRRSASAQAEARALTEGVGRDG